LGPVGIGASLYETKRALDDLRGSKKTGDKVVSTLQAASHLGSAIKHTGTSLKGIGGLAGSSSLVNVATTAIAGPAAMATGVADVLGGGYAAYQARQRERNLLALRDQGHPDINAMAEMAAASQETKKKRSILKMIGGGLGIAGGALLLGSNPLGW